MKIENLNGNELKDKINKSKQTEIVNFKQAHQISYIVDFYSEPLMKNGKYIKGTNLSDLLQLYYVDFLVKKEIYEMVARLERWLNVTILNLADDNIIKSRTTDSENSFGDVIKFYKSLSESEQILVFKKMKTNTKFKEPNTKEDFIKYLEASRYLRNFSVHHYSTTSYQYSVVIDNGNLHKEKTGMKGRDFSNDIKMIMSFFPNSKAKVIYKKIQQYYNLFSWSTKEIELVIEWLTKRFIPTDINDKNGKRTLTHLLNWNNVE